MAVFEGEFEERVVAVDLEFDGDVEAVVFNRLRADEKFGGDFFPYGLEPNRKTLEAFCQYAHEQGITRVRAKPEDLFPGGLDFSVLI